MRDIARSWYTSKKENNMNIDEMQEIIKCAKSLTYFAEQCVCLCSTGYKPLKLYPKQKQILESYQDNNFTILQKTRQAGSSMLSEITALWYALFNDNKTVILMAHKLDMSRSMIFCIIEQYKKLPNYLQNPIVREDVCNIHFKNGSTISAVSSNPDSLRGYAIDLLIIDEATYFMNNYFESVFKFNFPVLSANIFSNYRIL